MNIELILKITIIGLICAVVGLFLKKVGKDEFAIIVSIAGLVIVLVMLADTVLDFYNSLQSLFEL